MPHPLLSEVSPGPGFVRVFPASALFTVTADQPGDPPRSELSYDGPVYGSWSLGFRLLDEHRSRVVLARWGGLGLEAHAGRARLCVWGHVVRWWRLDENILEVDLHLTPVDEKAAAFHVRNQSLFGNNPPRVSAPGRPSHSAGLLWPHPSREEAVRSVELTLWRRDDQDLLCA